MSWLLDHAAAALVGGLVVLGLGWAGGRIHKAPLPLSRQLDEVLANAARDGLLVAVNREADLRGTGQKARIIILRPKLGGAWSRRSDELRIYETEDEGKRLQLALRLQPRTHLKQRLPYRINLVRIGRFGDGASRQAILRLDPSYADTTVPRPIAVQWDAGYRRYAVRGLLTRRVRLPRARGGFAAGTRRIYKPVDIPLVDGSVLRRVGATEAFSVQRNRIVAAYIVRQTCNACSGTWEVKGWRMDFDEPAFSGFECRFFKVQGRVAVTGRLIFRVRRVGDVERALRSARHRRCA